MKTRKATEHSALKSAAFDMNTSIEATVSRIPPHEIESVTGSLSDPKKKISFLGGRLSSSLATIAFVQLRAVRKNIHLLQPQSDGLREEIVDFGARDVLIVYDIRRYSPEIFKFCEQVHRRGTSIILITDTWISPISRFAKHLLAVQTETHSTWDTLAGILLVTEALIANTTSNLWPTARERMNKFEELREAATLSESETPGQR